MDSAGTSAPDGDDHRQWLTSFVRLPGGGRLLDLGCGDGRDLVRIAAAGTGRLRLTGLDADADKLRRAREALQGRPATLIRSDVARPLPFCDGSFDVVFSNDVLECVVDKAAHVRELHRILAPSGQLVLGHWDWDTQIIDGPDKDVVRRAVHAWCDWQQDWMQAADGWMGRRLRATVEKGGLFTGALHLRQLINTIYAPPWFGHARIQDFRHLVDRGLLSPADHEALLAGIEDLVRRGHYAYAITGFAWVGQPVAQP